MANSERNNGQAEAGPTLAGWGRVPVEGTEIKGEDLERLSRDVGISRGLGRSYGDSSLPASGGRALNTTMADRIRSFDEETGILHAEAGLSLRDIVDTFLPRRWFVPVTPGTQFVTLGGLVASDVHGKGHHVAGTFGQHVAFLIVRVADGRILRCSPTEESELFWATVGGMGLTGHILEVAFKMRRVASPWIYQEVERIENIDEFQIALERAAKKWAYTVGWIDCLSTGPNLGRGVLMAGDWASPDQAPKRYPKDPPKLTMPLQLPAFVLNRWSIKAFNFVYYWKSFRKKSAGIVHPKTFFYPLDFVQDWNRMYGPRGFTQYQCVLPRAAGAQSVRRFMEVLTDTGCASFLAVIKDCGPEGQGLLSFPKSGTSVALDIPVRDNTQAVVDRLNDFVIAERGRIYLTKDTFTRAEDFASMEPRLEAFNQVRRKWDPEQTIRSAQSVRMLGDRA